MAGKIFINYRRGDDPGFTQALYQVLEGDFTPEKLFMDVASGNIKAGANFAETLNMQVAAAELLLVIIGPRWEKLLADRLGDPKDFVVIEISAGLRYGKRIIPVLVGGSEMPHIGSLPKTLQPLLQFQAVELRPEHFKVDCQKLILELKGCLKNNENKQTAQTDEARISWALLNLKAPEAEYRERAIRTLSELAPSATEHIPALANLLREDKDSAVWRAAKAALMKMGPVAISALADAIDYRADAVINGKIWGMERYELLNLLTVEPPTAKSVEALFAIARDREKYAEIALIMIHRLGKSAAAVIPTLIAFLGDNDMEISIASARALRGAGAAAIPALKAVVLNSSDTMLSARAKTILEDITANEPRS